MSYVLKTISSFFFRTAKSLTRPDDLPFPHKRRHREGQGVERGPLVAFRVPEGAGLIKRIFIGFQTQDLKLTPKGRASGKVVSFYIVPLCPPPEGRACGHLPVNLKLPVHPVRTGQARSEFPDNAPSSLGCPMSRPRLS